MPKLLTGTVHLLLWNVCETSWFLLLHLNSPKKELLDIF